METRYVSASNNALYCLGDLTVGFAPKNPQLYRLDHAPLCRECDAFQCRRCVWMCRNLTREVNVPGHQQCVMAHVEREASRQLLKKIRTLGEYQPGTEIKKLDYFDPFEVLDKHK